MSFEEGMNVIFWYKLPRGFYFCLSILTTILTLENVMFWKWIFHSQKQNVQIYYIILNIHCLIGFFMKMTYDSFIQKNHGRKFWSIKFRVLSFEWGENVEISITSFNWDKNNLSAYKQRSLIRNNFLVSEIQQNFTK